MLKRLNGDYKTSMANCLGFVETYARIHVWKYFAESQENGF